VRFLRLLDLWVTCRVRSYWPSAQRYSIATALDITGLVEAAPERAEVHRRFAGRPAAEKPDHRHPRLLGIRRERPRSRAAEQSGELAATNHSMTSSAKASNLAGTSISRALAVFMLTTSSNFVGSSSGNSLGLAPLKILSTNAAARRKLSDSSTP